MKRIIRTTKASIIGDMVFGANDGIITTFAVVAGVAGASLSARIVLIMGLANLVGDGISMAVGDYLGRKSEQEVNERDRVKVSINPFRNAIAMLFAFLSAGFLPLLPYVFGITDNAFFISTVCAGVAMFIVGSLRSLVTKHHWIKSGFQVLAVGSIAAAAAYGVGFLLDGVLR